MHKRSFASIDASYLSSLPKNGAVWVIYFSGGFCAALGLMVMYGWFTNNPALLQIHPAFAAMQFNTALCFLLSGMGLTALISYRTMLARVVALPLFLLAGLTFAQYVFGADFGIDNLFLKSYINIQLSHPGRMAPNTSICFLLAAMAIAAGTMHAAFLKRAYMIRLSGLVMLFLSLISLSGYIFHVEAGFGWASLTRMALHTAIGFCVLGSGILAFASHQVAASKMLFKDAPSSYVPILAAFIMLIASLGSWIFLDTKEIKQAKFALSRSLEYVQENFKSKVDTRVRMLQRMTNRWQIERGTPYKKWQSDVRGYMIDQKDLRAMQWVDADNNILWIEALEKRDSSSADVFSAEQRLKIVQTALQTRRPVVSPPMATLDNDYAIMIAVPIFIGAESGGYIVGAYEVKALMESAMAGQFNADGWLEVANAGQQVVFQTAQMTEPDKARWNIYSIIEVRGTKLYFKAWPKREFLLEQRSTFPEMILAAGIILSFLIAHILRQSEISRYQTNLLTRSEETFRTAMEYAPVGMALIFPSGEWFKVNKALRDMMGYSEVEIFTLNLQSISHPDDWVADQQRLSALLRGDIQSFQVEKRFIHKSGRVVWALINASLARNPNGTPKYVIKQILDITERKEIERVKSEFVSMVSHELRTPLTSIRGSLGLILGAMSKSLPEKVRNHIGIAHRNCERLILLINDILDLDKITSGNMQFDIRPEKVSGLIEQAVEGNLSYAGKYNVHFQVSPIPPELMVYADDDRIIQVLANLLSNAAKFSPEQSVVSISAEQRGKFVRISVQDKGPGIPEGFRSRIFNKFCQADSSAARQKGGSGLGLSISKELVERMHGQIGFESEEGKGSLFWFDLPCTDEFGMFAAAPLNKQEAPRTNDNRPLILHIEDDADLSGILANALSDRAEIIQAPTLHNAEELLKQRNFSLVILDINMPDGNGISLLDRLTTLTSYPVPWLILSAYEAGREVQERVAATMVKSRVPEAKVIETILKVMQQTNIQPPGEEYGT